ncbi:MAG: hypothetical protein QXR58_02905 [Candidatus Micrarchaeaceae archaeon]
MVLCTIRPNAEGIKPIETFAASLHALTNCAVEKKLVEINEPAGGELGVILPEIENAPMNTNTIITVIMISPISFLLNRTSLSILNAKPRAYSSPTIISMINMAINDNPSMLFKEVG